jgi:hypothetical protein
MSFKLVILGVGIVIDIALNLWILKRLKEINKEQTCFWTINFGDGGLVVGEAEKQEEEQEK